MEIKQKRKELGLRQREVAEAGGITQGYYSKVEKGEKTPSVKAAKKLAAILKVDWTSFFD